MPYTNHTPRSHTGPSGRSFAATRNTTCLQKLFHALFAGIPHNRARIIATDVIVRAQRRLDPTPVWVAVEVAGRVDGDDIRRSRESADTLATVFGEEALPVVAGYRIDGPDRNRADAAGVRYLEVPQRP